MSRLYGMTRKITGLIVLGCLGIGFETQAELQPLRVHLVRGLWSREYRLEEAVALAGAGLVTESWHAQGMGFGYVGGWDPNAGGNVPEFPGTPADLLTNNVLVICNINSKSFTPAQQQSILDFVRNGGGVLLLGGRFAFGSQWAGTPLAELAPVSFVGTGFDLTNAVKGLAMAAGPDRLGGKPAALHWEKAPRVFWYHAVNPKPEARIAVVADGHPLLITGTCGKGRVALFAGSVMGDPPAGTLPFWQWDDWPRLMGDTLAWLAVSSDRKNGVLNASAVEAGKVDTLLRMLASGEMPKAAAGAATDGDLLAAMDDSPVVEPGQKEAAAALARLAALKGMAAIGDPKALPVIRESIAAHQPGGRFDKIEGAKGVEAYMITTETRLYQTSLLAALACGDATTAVPLADALLGNVYVASRARSGYNSPSEAQMGAAGSLPHILAWQAELLTMLRSVPVERLAPLAEPLAAIDDIRMVPGVCAAFGGRPLTPAIKNVLKTSKVKAVAALGNFP